nr:GNAT family N-acetyltransferase [Gillisia sp. CAL575]
MLINDNLDPLYTKELILWKHLHNPFGKSIAMVAVIDAKIVGVVFYMRYNFENNKGKIVKTIRPLDVCTASSQRGKGIFKILLQKCLETAKDYDLLFSTPNKNSYPEFIKLGWSALKDQYYFKVGIISPLNFGRSLKLSEVDLSINVSRSQNNHNYLVTANSLEFIKWRYKDSDYNIKQFIIDGSMNMIVYRVEKLKGIKTIILCDYMGDETIINEAVKSISRLENIFVLYCLNNSITKNIKFIWSKKQGDAIMIYKENNCNFNDNISISLGDIEARL